MRTWQRNLIIILLAALVLFIGYTFVDMRKQNQKEQDALQRISKDCAENIRELEEEKLRIETEIADTKKEMYDLTANMGSVVFICVEPDARIMEDVEPYMDSYDYPAVVAMSDDYFPGDTGCLTDDDMDYLIMKGWETAISADRSTDIEAIYDRIVNAGYSAPSCVYFPLDDCGPEQEETMKKLGIKTVIEYKSEQETDEEEDRTGLFRLPAYGNDADGARNRFLSGIENSESIAFTVGYRLKREMFRADNFANMIRTVSKNMEKGYVLATDVSGAFERYELHKSLMDYTYDKYEGKLAELNAQLEQIKEDIRFAPEK